MEDLLDYGKPYIQEFRVGSIYDVVVKGIIVCEQLAEQGQVRIVNNVPNTLGPIVIDEKRLPQVFSNLIKNAIPGAAAAPALGFLSCSELYRNMAEKLRRPIVQRAEPKLS